MMSSKEWWDRYIHDYYRLHDTLRERTLKRLAAVDSELGCAMGMHLAHNWYLVDPTRYPDKSPAVVAIMAQHERVSRYLYDRREREYRQRIRAESPGSRISTVTGWEVA